MGLVLATVLVYLVMVAQFRSFLDPFIVMVTVPLGFIGVAAILYLTGTRLNIQSFMGIIMMIGIVVEYAIVLLDFANHRLRDGADLQNGHRRRRGCAVPPNSDDLGDDDSGTHADGVSGIVWRSFRWRSRTFHWRAPLWAE